LTKHVGEKQTNVTVESICWNKLLQPQFTLQITLILRTKISVDRLDVGKVWWWTSRGRAPALLLTVVQSGQSTCPYIWTNMNFLHQRMIYSKFDSNWCADSGNFQKLTVHFDSLLLSPFRVGCYPSFYKKKNPTQIHSPQEWLKVVLEKWTVGKFTGRRTDRHMTDNRQQKSSLEVQLRWAKKLASIYPMWEYWHVNLKCYGSLDLERILNYLTLIFLQSYLRNLSWNRLFCYWAIISPWRSILRFIWINLNKGSFTESPHKSTANST
jgi:hypothetical protein